MSATVVNDGQAPFYYDWPVEFALLDDGGTPAAVSSADRTVRGVEPGGEAVLNGPLPSQGVASGHYRIALRVKNPLDGGVPVRFANAGQTTDSSGWVVVGDTTI